MHLVDLPNVHVSKGLAFDRVGALRRVDIFRHDLCCRGIDILIDQLDGEGIRIGPDHIFSSISRGSYKSLNVMHERTSYWTDCHLIVRGRSGSIFSPIRGEVTTRPVNG